jgi:hypothetical protein
MKKNLLCFSIGLCTLSLVDPPAFGQGTAFTYQGRLNNNGAPVSGRYDLQFTLFATNITGAAIAGPVTNAATAVSNGLFTCAIDFGQGVFTGVAYWLDIAVRTNGGGAFTELSPRQPLTPAPYSIFASSASGLHGLSVQQNTNGAPNVIGGSSINFVSNGVVGATIGGGGATNYLGQIYSNSVTASFGTVGGGLQNLARGTWATVGGGWFNTASGQGSFVGGGTDGLNIQGNLAGGGASAVVGGLGNFAYGDYDAVGGGELNIAFGLFSVVAGGIQNHATNWYSMIPGGGFNNAGGQYSFAAGRQAQALHDGAFVWADSQNQPFPSTASNQFNIRASGGIRVNDDTTMSFGGTIRQMLNLWGTSYAIGVQDYCLYFRTEPTQAGFAWFNGGTFTNNTFDPGPGGIKSMSLDSSGNLTVRGTVTANGVLLTSDRAAKENIDPIDASRVLERLAAMPISQWNYKQAKGERHIGPMAQDFHAAFGLGEDDKHIAVVDEAGVALAAIQGLNRKLEQKETEITELKGQLNELKDLVRAINHKPN